MLKPLGVAIGLVALLLLQPDFGSSSLLLAITAGMLVLGGVNMPRMFGPVLVLLVGFAAIAIAEPYRVRRFTSFMDPWADPFNSGYQLTNALMAVGRGEWFGVGLGASVQKLAYLPEAHTDFILAVIAEELGFVGVLPGASGCTRCWPGARSGSACAAWKCAAISPATARSASRCG